MGEVLMAGMGASAMINAGLEIGVDYPKECENIQDGLGLIDDANKWANKLITSINNNSIDVIEHTIQLDQIIKLTKKMIRDHRRMQAKKSNKRQLMSLITCFVISMLLMLKLMNHYNLI